MSNKQKANSLKDRFLTAVTCGELGSRNDRGVLVTIKAFKLYFNDNKTDYINSFLPAATLDPGRSFISHTKYVVRVSSGVYLVPNEVIETYVCCDDIS